MTFHKTWDKVLGVGEQVQYEFSLSPRFININILFWFIVGIATVWFYGVGIIIFGIALFYFGFYLRWANHFAITNKRILIHRGWLSTRMTSADFTQITDVEVRQGFTERIMYRSGKLLVNTAGSAAYEIVLPNIGDPYLVKKKLSEAMEKDRKQNATLGTVTSQPTP